MTPSSDWHARLGPLDFSVGIRHFELRGVFPEQPHALPDSAAPPVRRIRAAEDDALDREPEGGTTG